MKNQEKYYNSMRFLQYNEMDVGLYIENNSPECKKKKRDSFELC